MTLARWSLTWGVRREWRNMTTNIDISVPNFQDGNKYAAGGIKWMRHPPPTWHLHDNFSFPWQRSQTVVTEVGFLNGSETRESISSHHTSFMAAWRHVMRHFPSVLMCCWVSTDALPSSFTLPRLTRVQTEEHTYRDTGVRFQLEEDAFRHAPGSAAVIYSLFSHVGIRRA